MKEEVHIPDQHLTYLEAPRKSRNVSSESMVAAIDSVKDGTMGGVHSAEQ